MRITALHTINFDLQPARIINLASPPPMKPTILFVPGFWEGPAPFAPVTTLLQTAGYPTQTATLPSTGASSPNNPSMKDDIAAVRSRIIDLIDDDDDGGGGKTVVLVLHSAGGFVGSNAAEGLDVKARRGKGLKGGVCRIVFLTGAVFPVGYRHAPLPFFTYDVFPPPKLSPPLHPLLPHPI